jgi:hypothetical protein
MVFPFTNHVFEFIFSKERSLKCYLILKLQCLSVRLSVRVGSAWKILPVTAVFWGVGEGRARWSTGLGGQHGRGRGDGWGRTGRGGPNGRPAGEGASMGGGGHGRGRTGRGEARALSVWTKIGQCLEDSSSHCPFPVELVTNKAGARQGGQGSRCGGPREVPVLLKKFLGKTEGPASNQTKLQF